MFRLWGHGLSRTVLAVCFATLATACSPAAPGGPVKGEADLRGVSWSRGAVVLAGEWAFRDGFRMVPDAWSGSVAGGVDGRGWGSYRLRLVVGEAPPLALRYGSVSTAFLIRANGVELVRVGNPDADPAKAVSAYAPGTVRLPRAPVIDLEIFVSNHDYRVGGLWTAPSVGPAAVIEDAQWVAEAQALALAAALAVIGVAALLLFSIRRSELTFLHLGLFALLVALRSLVTGEYTLVKILPWLPFDTLVRLEYWSAFLPLPSAAAFFLSFYPGLIPRWGARALIGPSLAFAVLTILLPLPWLTRSILWYYPLSIPALVYGSVVLIRRIFKDGRSPLLFVGVAILAGTALTDTVAAALFATTGTLVPWGMAVFVALQATTLARRFLAAFQATELHLAEKEFLVREIHHRVKNSLQVVASLVTLQANRIQDAEQKEVFQALRRRITAIALVHEKLHSQESAGRPDLGEYLRDLLSLQYPRDLLSSGGVVWDIQAEPLAAEVEACIDAGLILTELVSNANKHVLLPKRGQKLQVDIRIRQRSLVIEVSDDGPGFPPDFRPEGSKGLGFRLVLSLLGRNAGTLTFPEGPGGRVRVELGFPTSD